MTLEGQGETHVPAQPTPHSLPLLPLKRLPTGTFPPPVPISPSNTIQRSWCYLLETERFKLSLTPKKNFMYMKYISNSKHTPNPITSLPALPPPWSKQHQLLPDYFNNLICFHAATLAPPLTAYSQQNSPKYASKTQEIQSVFYLRSVLCSVMTEGGGMEGGREAEEEGDICIHMYTQS